MASNWWLSESEEPNAWGPAEPSTKAQRGKSTTRAWQTCTKEEIKEYKKFNVLYGERKFARPFTKQKQTLSFTDDLPMEIRLLVYGYLLKTPDHFELWAPWDLTKKGSRCQNQFNTYASSKKKALKIIRLNKKIHDEVTTHFYGQPNFRFSTYNGFMAMAVFNHTLGRTNCDYIKHITVQIPSCDDMTSKQGANACMWYIAEWNAFEAIQKKRGMRIPQLGFRRKHYNQGRVRGEYNYHKAVVRGFRQLNNMASLKTLEILIPWDYDFIQGGCPPVQPCECLTEEEWEELGPEDLVWHYIQAHSNNPEYWAMLAELKQNTASEDLTISLVLVHKQRGEVEDRKRHFLLQGRWLAAYASVMGYRFGHTRWEKDNSTYVVRYDEDEMLLVSPDQAEDDAMLEPPELS